MPKKSQIYEYNDSYCAHSHLPHEFRSSHESLDVKILMLIKWSSTCLPFILITEPRMVIRFWACHPIFFEHMYFWCLFLDPPHLTTYQSNIGVQIVTLLDFMQRPSYGCGWGIEMRTLYSCAIHTYKTELTGRFVSSRTCYKMFHRDLQSLNLATLQLDKCKKNHWSKHDLWILHLIRSDSCELDWQCSNCFLFFNAALGKMDQLLRKLILPVSLRHCLLTLVLSTELGVINL
jgi:hypothetical protein